MLHSSSEGTVRCPKYSSLHRLAAGVWFCCAADCGWLVSLNYVDLAQIPFLCSSASGEDSTFWSADWVMEMGTLLSWEYSSLCLMVYLGVLNSVSLYYFTPTKLNSRSSSVSSVERPSSCLFCHRTIVEFGIALPRTRILDSFPCALLWVCFLTMAFISVSLTYFPSFQDFILSFSCFSLKLD